MKRASVSTLLLCVLVQQQQQQRCDSFAPLHSHNYRRGVEKIHTPVVSDRMTRYPPKLRSTRLYVSSGSRAKATSKDQVDDDNDEEEDDESSSHTPFNQLAETFIEGGEHVTKFRRLKDVMWLRETQEDLTAAEFACSVEAAAAIADDSKRTRKRAVDYEKLLTNLNTRIGELICEPFDETRLGDDDDLRVVEDTGMGRFSCTTAQRDTLLKKLLLTRGELVTIVNENEKGKKKPIAIEEGKLTFELPELEIPELKVEIPKEEESTQSVGPKLYVRDDGTVEWEGALQDRAALREFGGAVWARINGETADALDEKNKEKASSGEKKAVTAKIKDTPAIIASKNELDRVKNLLSDQEKSHLEFLSAGISAGQVVANVKLASLGPELRTKIRLSSQALETTGQQVAYKQLVYELERIFAYLVSEIGNPAAKGYIPLQDRLNIAEFGLIEGQVENCSRELTAKGTLDADILAVITEQLMDFKRRLGIDYYVTGLTYDREAIMVWIGDISRKTKDGLGFYVKGCKLFWNDVVFCSALIARAAQGYTLKPREVRTIRRTFKDVVTFVPVVIILIIPLSPVGHVLVFGAIQRFFPDFFPSCFTEQRQNLLQLYETAEYTEFTINETLKERFIRFLEATTFSIASSSRDFYKALVSPRKSDENDNDNDKTDGN